MPGRKTDVKDSEWIADLLRHGLIARSFVPPQPIRVLRDLVRYRRKLVESGSTERNRLLELLETCNIKLASFASNVFGVSGMAMLRALVTNASTSTEMAQLARGRLRDKIPALALALDGQLDDEHRFLLQMQLDRLDQVGRCHPIRCFVYGRVRFVGQQLHVPVRARTGSRGRCSGCGKRGPTYDTARQTRSFEFVPLWGFAVFLVYPMRRIACPTCRVRTEQVPWADGKNRCCNVYRVCLARWARRLPWSEVGQIFGTTWGVVHRAVRWVVDYGLAHRDVPGHHQAAGWPRPPYPRPAFTW